MFLILDFGHSYSIFVKTAVEKVPHQTGTSLIIILVDSFSNHHGTEHISTEKTGISPTNASHHKSVQSIGWL